MKKFRVKIKDTEFIITDVASADDAKQVAKNLYAKVACNDTLSDYRNALNTASQELDKISGDNIYKNEQNSRLVISTLSATINALMRAKRHYEKWIS